MYIQNRQTINAEQRPWCIDWHPNGNQLACSGSQKWVNLYTFSAQNCKLQKLSRILCQNEHTKTIRCIKFNHNGSRLAMASFDSTISVWLYNQENMQYQFLSHLEGHENQVKCISWSYTHTNNQQQYDENKSKLASCSRDKNIWIWEFDTISYQYVCQSVLQGHTQDVKYIQWMPNESGKLISCSYDNTMRIWEMQDDDYVCKQVLQGHNSIVWSVKIIDCKNTKMENNSINKWIFSCSQDCTVIQWQKINGKYQKYHVYNQLHSLPIYTIDVLSQNMFLTVSIYDIQGSADNSIALIKVQSSSLNQGQNHEQKLQANKLLSQSNNIEVKKQQHMPQVICRQFHGADVNCIKINKKHSNIFASCSDDQTIKLWSIHSYEKQTNK